MKHNYLLRFKTLLIQFLVGFGLVTSAMAHDPAIRKLSAASDFKKSGIRVKHTPPSPSRLYVKADASGANTGLNWEDAFPDLQSAIHYPNLENLTEIWVAGGEYKPTSTNDPRISYKMLPDVAIYGGFVGTETELSQRPPVTLSAPSSTTLSGDIGTIGTSTDNSYHIFDNPPGLSATSVLDGFVIMRGGSFSGFYGGGMKNDGGGVGNFCNPTVRNCVFRDNGYGISIYTSVSAVLNVAFYGGSASPHFINCLFLNNYAFQGAASYNYTAEGGTASPQYTNCAFIGNRAYNGAAIYNNDNTNCETSPIFTNCSFLDNISVGVSEGYESGAINTFGGGDRSHVQLINCVLFNNMGPKTFDTRRGLYRLTVSHSLLESSVTGYTDGGGNRISDASPFVSATDIRLTECAPAINTGTNAATDLMGLTTDLAGNPRFFDNGTVDMGAVEYQGTPKVLSLTAPGVNTALYNQPFSQSFTVSGGAEPYSFTQVSGTMPPGLTLATTGALSGTLTQTGSFAFSVLATDNDGCSVTSSSPYNLTVNAVVTGSFDGFIYGADCATFRGWAWDRNKPNTPVMVDILDGETVIATLLADAFRQDLVDNGKGNGRHAFLWPIPDALKDGQPHSLRARITGNPFELKNAPKTLICTPNPGPEGNKPPQPPVPTVLIAPLVAQVGVPFSGTLVAFTDPESGTLSYSLTGLPEGLQLQMPERIIGGIPTQAGTFVLTYRATDPQGAANSVSFALTVNPMETTTVTGNFDGYLDKLDCGGIRGWVWDRNKPNTPLTVEFYTESSPGNVTVLGSTLANIYRQDLKDAGKGNGAHAYNFTPPGSVTNGTAIRARVLGSSYLLKGSPKAFQCAPARLSAGMDAELTVTVLGNPVKGDAVEVEIQGAIVGRQLSLELTNVLGQLVGNKSVTATEATERHRISVPNQTPGLLLLRVNTPRQTKTVKIQRTN
ncbi:putative Ig domain-containing protein [Larkinella rosea]|uniref:Dystroglycan-type cadherin-like domain-containing protein n=1 Tax=Larkinella rosea TaxID=2025312 RepID=A0A3P1C0I2_9BACT|nr:putative Ig domain-containing protein [Larkinella rosea]RRB06636.1 hypothetical protein EHT25_02230 [Larkinella rosea]